MKASVGWSRWSYSCFSTLSPFEVDGESELLIMLRRYHAFPSIWITFSTTLDPCLRISHVSIKHKINKVHLSNKLNLRAVWVSCQLLQEKKNKSYSFPIDFLQWRRNCRLNNKMMHRLFMQKSLTCFWGWNYKVFVISSFPIFFQVFSTGLMKRKEIEWTFRIICSIAVDEGSSRDSIGLKTWADLTNGKNHKFFASGNRHESLIICRWQGGKKEQNFQPLLINFSRRSLIRCSQPLVNTDSRHFSKFLGRSSSDEREKRKRFVLERMKLARYFFSDYIRQQKKFKNKWRSWGKIGESFETW